MKDIIKKSAIIGLVGVPVFMLTCAISTGITNGIVKSVENYVIVKK